MGRAFNNKPDVDIEEKYRIAKQVTLSLCNGTETSKSNIFLASSRRVGHGPKREIQIKLIFPMEIFHDMNDRRTFHAALDLFPETDGRDIIYGGMPETKALGVKVYFPLPYKSAERFAKSDRSEFMKAMACHKVALEIKRYIGDELSKELFNKYPDPRHPDEIKWEERKKAVKDFVAKLVPKRKSKPERNYREYL